VFAGTLAIAALITLTPFCSFSQPRIEFDEEAHDWGRLLEGEKTTHSFHFRNAGTKPLRIFDVTTTCGCTAALASDSLVMPGEEGSVKVTFDSRGRMGHQSKHVNVRTNDPEHTTVRLGIKGDVRVVLRVDPKNINFGEVPAGEKRRMTITLAPGTSSRFDILDMELPGEYFEVRQAKAIDILRRTWGLIRERAVRRFASIETKAALGIMVGNKYGKSLSAGEGKSRSIAVTLLPTAPIGRHVGRLKIKTDLEAKPSVEVAVYADVVGDLKAVPQYHSFGSIPRGEREEAVFRVVSRSGRRFRVSGATCTSAHASAEAREVTPGAEYEVRLRVSPKAPVGQLHGTVVVRTTDKVQPEIDLKFYARVVN
jgi:hypothetical protein